MNFSAIRDFVCRLVTVAAIVATAVSCSEYEFGGSTDTDEGLSGEVIIAIPELSVPRVGTRVAIDDADKEGAVKTLSLKWTDDDAFALWASRTDDGEPVGDGHKNMKFSYHGDSKYQDGKVYFASYEVPEMSAGEYSYTAFYPYQEDETKVDRVNNRVTYTIPTEQSGLYNGSCDIMSAVVAEFGEALAINFYQDINLTFKHQTHALKITVPKEKNGFGDDKKITRIRIEFSKPVAGDLTFDTVTTDPDSKPDLSGITENYIDVRFTEEHPFKAGEPFWVFIAPVDMSDGVVKFTAFGGDDEKYQSEPSTSTPGLFKDLTRGVITPVNLGIGEAFSITWFEYTIEDWSRLGEEVESLNITLPEGLSLADRSEDESRSKKVERDSEGKYRFAFRTGELERAAASGGVNIDVQFESEHAIVSPYASDAEKFVITTGKYEPEGINVFKIDCVPYLFEEDFSSVTTFSDHDNASTTARPTNSDIGNGNRAFDIYDSYKCLSGWTGQRVGAEAGLAIRVCLRSEVYIIAPSLNNGRLDTPPMSGLKDGKTASLRLTFNYAMNMNDQAKNNYKQHYFALGWHTNSGVQSDTAGTLSASYGWGNNVTLIADQQGGDKALEGTFSTVCDMNEVSYIASGCVAATRFVWDVYGSATLSSGTSFNNQWLYLDNIKVSIVKD